MVIKISTKNELTNNLNNDKVNIIMFSASWCGPCKKIRPLYMKMGNDSTNNNYLYIDIDEMEDNCEYLDKVESVPTFMVFIGNNFVSKLSFNELEGAIKDCEKMRYQMKINDVIINFKKQGLHDNEIKKILMDTVNKKS